MAQAYNVLGVIQRRQGALPAAVANLEQSCLLAQRLGDAGAYMAAMNNLALAAAASGETARGVSLVRTPPWSKRRGEVTAIAKRPCAITWPTCSTWKAAKRNLWLS